ncbi:hypothetical protein NQ176_g1356 [Zarea fungicola]|uniref:Uncharacterized protein n=1 Tax=Zarea fungicola TaxID=93591 RepID=A0ACC1NU82_9HYPO|nr:hypothetical protein NQ176_g1356 [Lecanicillium fungicola]
MFFLLLYFPSVLPFFPFAFKHQPAPRVRFLLHTRTRTLTRNAKVSQSLHATFAVVATIATIATIPQVAMALTDVDSVLEQLSSDSDSMIDGASLTDVDSGLEQLFVDSDSMIEDASDFASDGGVIAAISEGTDEHVADIMETASTSVAEQASSTMKVEEDGEAAVRASKKKAFESVMFELTKTIQKFLATEPVLVGIWKKCEPFPQLRMSAMQLLEEYDKQKRELTAAIARLQMQLRMKRRSDIAKDES